MERFDFKTISVAIGAEDRFNTRFSVFGWEMVTSQSFYANDEEQSYRNEMEMAHYYEASQVDYALAGIDINGAKERVPSYIRLSYRRNRLDPDYRNWIKAESAYNRITYDIYCLYAKARYSRNTRRLPVGLLILFLLLIIVGCGLFALGYFKNGASVGFGSSLASIALWGGIYLAVFSFAFLIIILFLWHIVKSDAVQRYRRYAKQLFEIKSKYRKTLRNSEFSSCPIDEVKAIEKQCKIDSKVKNVKKRTTKEKEEMPEDEEFLFAE